MSGVALSTRAACQCVSPQRNKLRVRVISGRWEDPSLKSKCTRSEGPGAKGRNGASLGEG